MWKVGKNRPAASGMPIRLYASAQKKLRRMRAIVSAARSRQVTTSISDGFISTTSAVSMATSVPEPSAIPTSACARAGASLTPSPTIATSSPS